MPRLVRHKFLPWDMSGAVSDLFKQLFPDLDEEDMKYIEEVIPSMVDEKIRENERRNNGGGDDL